MMSRIDKLRFSVACTDRWDEIVIISDKKQTTPHDEPAWYYLNNPENKRLTQSCNSNLVFLCWFMPRRMEHFFLPLR